MRTITQAAQELEVSRKKIYNEIEKLKIETKKDGKNNYISDDDFKRLKIRVKEQMEEHTQNTQERIRNVLERDRSTVEGNLSDREYTDLKERIRQLEQQIEKKDLQIQDQASSLIEAMKFNNTLLDTNNKLVETNNNLNAVTYKLLNPPNLEEAITVEKELNSSSWLKKIFKKTGK